MMAHTLWHYTDAQGLLGILTSRKLRFGDSRFLNDRTERQYGVELARQVLEVAIARGTTETDFLKVTREYLDSATTALDIYLFSMSETPESISQWQRYGADGFGYCIGLDLKRLRSTHLLTSKTAMLKQVIYEPTAQRRMFTAAVRHFIKKWQTKSRFPPNQTCPATSSTVNKPGTRFRKSTPEIWMRLHAVRLAGDLVQLALQMKHFHFRDEREWRLLFQLAHDPSVTALHKPQFFARGAYLKPSFDLPVTPERQGQGPRLPPIKLITIGPKLDQDLAAATLKQLLFQQEVGDIRIEASDLARTWR